jgi:hypothetical protein
MEVPVWNERFRHVAEAHGKIAAAVLDAVKEHDLTLPELVSILCTELQGWAKEEGTAGR